MCYLCMLASSLVCVYLILFAGRKYFLNLLKMKGKYLMVENTIVFVVIYMVVPRGSR